MSDMADVRHRAAVFNLDVALNQARDASVDSALAYRVGMDYAELRHRTIMRAIAKAYTAALTDPNTRIPSALGTMLEAVRQTVRGWESEAAAHPDVTARVAGL